MTLNVTATDGGAGPQGERDRDRVPPVRRRLGRAVPAHDVPGELPVDDERERRLRPPRHGHRRARPRRTAVAHQPPRRQQRADGERRHRAPRRRARRRDDVDQRIRHRRRRAEGRLRGTARRTRRRGTRSARSRSRRTRARRTPPSFGAPDGEYDIRGVAYDYSGNATPTSIVTFRLDNTAPRAIDVQGVNGGLAGTLDAGDQLTLTLQRGGRSPARSQPAGTASRRSPSRCASPHGGAGHADDLGRRERDAARARDEHRARSRRDRGRRDARRDARALRRRLHAHARGARRRIGGDRRRRQRHAALDARPPR